MEMNWFVLACFCVLCLLFFMFRMLYFFELYLNTVKDSSILLELIKDCLKEYLNNEHRRIGKNLESGKPLTGPEQNSKESDSKKLGEGDIEGSFSNIVSSKYTTAVPFGEDVSE